MKPIDSYQGFSDQSNSIRLLRSLTRQSESESDSSKLIILLVGLPARGKSYIARKICTFMNWRGHKCKVFNAGQHRRETAEEAAEMKSDFFSVSNTECINKRDFIALELLENAINWLRTSFGQIAIFDATNTTVARRKKLVDKIKEFDYRFIFIESICDDEKVIEKNLNAKAKYSPDFRNMPFDEAITELKKRLDHYKKVYEALSDNENIGYIKLINLGTKIVCHKLNGFISRLLMVFLVNLKVDKKSVFLTRAGNCISEQSGSHSKARDCGLSKEGINFAKKLAEHIREKNLKKLQVWCSPLKRSIETAQFFDINRVRTEKEFLNSPEEDCEDESFSIFSTPILSMVNQGVCYGMKLSAVKQTSPDIYSEWIKDPLIYRFPGGESYMDAVERIESLVIDLEHINSHVMIITHISVMRILYAYFKSIPVEQMVYVEFPQGLVIEFKPSLYGWIESRVDLMENDRAVDVEDELNKNIEEIPIKEDVIY